MVRSKLNRGGRPPSVRRQWKVRGGRWRTGYLSDAINTIAASGWGDVLVRTDSAHEAHVIAASAHTQARRLGLKVLCSWRDPNLLIEGIGT